MAAQQQQPDPQQSVVSSQQSSIGLTPSAAQMVVQAGPMKSTNSDFIS
jgi:hypothetical protein